MTGVNLLNDKTEKKVDSVLVAQKFCHKGALFGQISNGNGVIALNDQYSLKFIAKDDKFCVLELSRHALGNKPINQTWQKTKFIKKVKKQDDIVFKVDDSKEELF